MEHFTALCFCLSLILPATEGGWPYAYSGEHFHDLMGTPIDWDVASRSAGLGFKHIYSFHTTTFPGDSNHSFVTYSDVALVNLFVSLHNLDLASWCCTAPSVSGL